MCNKLLEMKHCKAQLQVSFTYNNHCYLVDIFSGGLSFLSEADFIVNTIFK